MRIVYFADSDELRMISEGSGSKLEVTTLEILSNVRIHEEQWKKRPDSFCVVPSSSHFTCGISYMEEVSSVRHVSMCVSAI